MVVLSFYLIITYNEGESIYAIRWSGIIVKFLEKAGINVGFGIGGGYIDPLLYRIKQSNLRFYVSSSESGATYSADGYARAKNYPAFVVSTAGPGETNTITGVTNAYADSSPILLITGHVPVQNMGKNSFQDNSILSHNIVEMFQHITKSSYFVYSTESLFEFLRMSIINMLSMRKRPVHLTVPYDVLVNKIEVKERDFDLSFLNIIDTRLITSNIKGLLDFIKDKTDKTIIIAGNGVLQANAVTEFETILKLTDMYFVTTPKAKSLSTCYKENFLGVLGLGGTCNNEIFDYFKNIIILGSSLSELSYIGYIEKIEEKDIVYQIDIDYQEIGKIIHNAQGIVGDIKEILKFTVKQMELYDKNSIKPKQILENFLIAKKNNYNTPQNQLIKTGDLLSKLSKLFPENTIFFADSGSSIPFSVHNLDLKTPESYFIPLNYAPMGWAIGAAIGGKIACPEKTAVCLTGEHSFLMEGLEICTTKKYDIPVIFIILNNTIYNMPYHRQLELYGESFYSKFDKMNIIPIIQGMGLDGKKITALEQIDQKLIDNIIENKKTFVFDIDIDINEKIPSSTATNIGNVKDLKNA